MANKLDFDCAIFDLDGTLLDSTDVWAKIDINFLGKRGIPLTEEYATNIKKHTFVTGSKYVVERYQLDENPEDIAREWYEMAIEDYTHHIALKDNAAEFLDKLKSKGCKLTVATSLDRSLFEGCLKRNGVYDLFDSFTQTSEVKRTKGYPDVYELAATRCSTEVERCVVFEDILKGVEGAKAGGFYTVGVYDKASEKDQAEIKKLCDRFIFNYSEMM